jgi:hypothetical protein
MDNMVGRERGKGSSKKLQVRSIFLQILLHLFISIDLYNSSTFSSDMASVINHDFRNEDHIGKILDPEQQRESALVAGLPKSLGAGVSASFINSKFRC